MSVLRMFKNLCNEVSLTEPSIVVASNDRAVKQLIATTYRVGNDLRSFEWPQLTRRASITLVSGQAAYAMPADYDKEIADTHWNSSTFWPLYGPLTANQWETLQNGEISSGFFQRYRIFGYADDTFTITPTPTASGDVLVFEYTSVNFFRPRTWESGLTFGAASYCFYNGYYFYTAISGVSGGSPPTPSSLNDGGIVWTLYSDPYEAFTADTDEFLLNENLVGLGVQWNYLASKGLPYQHLESKWLADRNTMMAKAMGMKTISLVPRYADRRWLGNIPETGFGL